LSRSAARPGTSSSNGHGKSCPSACAGGHMGSDQCKLVLINVQKRQFPPAQSYMRALRSARLLHLYKTAYQPKELRPQLDEGPVVGHLTLGGSSSLGLFPTKGLCRHGVRSTRSRSLGFRSGVRRCAAIVMSRSSPTLRARLNRPTAHRPDAAANHPARRHACHQ
jgi:hypothetical protein